jgi:hypothetical protein
MGQQPPDIEPTQPDIAGAAPAPKLRQTLGKIGRELSVEELGQSGVVKMLIGDLDRLESELAEAKDYRRLFHDAEKRISRLEEKGRRSTAGEILSMGSLAIGATGVGHGLALLNSQTDHNVGVALLVLGGVLTVIGVAAKAVHW